MGRRCPDLLTSFVPEPTTGCFLWIGCIRSDGYGGYGKRVLAHRAMWEKVNGPVPAGMELHHKCGVKSCVNTEHLMVTTRRDHPDAVAHVRKKKTTCVNGHSLDDALRNDRFVWNADGSVTVVVWRACRTCQHIHAAAWRQRQKLTSP